MLHVSSILLTFPLILCLMVLFLDYIVISYSVGVKNPPSKNMKKENQILRINIIYDISFPYSCINVQTATQAMYFCITPMHALVCIPVYDSQQIRLCRSFSDVFVCKIFSSIDVIQQKYKDIKATSCIKIHNITFQYCLKSPIFVKQV